MVPTNVTCSSVSPLRLMAWTSAPKRPEKPRRRAPDATETEDRANRAVKCLVGDELVEPPFAHLLVLNRQALGRGQRHCQHELRHRTGKGSRVRSNGHIAREEMQRHVVDPRAQELDEAERRHRGDITRCDLDPGILGDQYASPRPRLGPVRRRKMGQEQQIAVGAEFLPVGGAHTRQRVVGDKDARRNRDHPRWSVTLTARGSGGRAVAMLSREYQEMSGANLCGRVTGWSILVMEPVNPVPDRDCEPFRVYRRLVSVSLAVTGVEIGVSTIGSATATPGRAHLRTNVPVVVMRCPRCRHGFAGSLHTSTPTASGLMTTRPRRQRRSSSESQRERAIVCGMGGSRATTAEIHNLRRRMSRRRSE